MIFDNPEHVIAVQLVSLEGSYLLSHESRYGIASAGQQTHDSRSIGTGFIGVIRDAGSHQQGCQIGNSESGCPEDMCLAGDIFCRELTPLNGSFQEQLSQRNHVEESFDIKCVAVAVKEPIQVNGGQVAAGVVKEGILAAGVGGIETVMRCHVLAVFARRAGVPGIEGIGVLGSRIGALPGSFIKFIPKLIH
ncbi:hypothetical protein DSECCO2_479120 [anaerobic digester metagenome]